jgi:hypothetical protein
MNVGARTEDSRVRPDGGMLLHVPSVVQSVEVVWSWFVGVLYTLTFIIYSPHNGIDLELTKLP